MSSYLSLPHALLLAEQSGVGRPTCSAASLWDTVMRSLLVFEILKFVTYGVILKISRLQGERELTFNSGKEMPPCEFAVSQSDPLWWMA